MPPGRGYRNPKAKTPSRKKAKATGPTPRASARAREVASPNARFNRGFANEFNPKRDTTTPSIAPRQRSAVAPAPGPATGATGPTPRIEPIPAPTGGTARDLRRKRTATVSTRPRLSIMR